MAIPPTYRIKKRYLIIEGSFEDLLFAARNLFGDYSKLFMIKKILNFDENIFLIRCNKDFLKHVLACVAYSNCRCLRVCGTIKSSLKKYEEITKR
jgi:RNase P/RNase MRP subunit POP5